MNPLPAAAGRYLNGATSMRKTLWKVGLTTAAVVLMSSSSAYAQTTATATLNVNVTVASRARLTLSAASISFADADPDTNPTLTAAPINVNVGARTAATSIVTLTLAGPQLHVGRRLDRHRQPVVDGSGGRICRRNGGHDGNAGRLVDGPGRSYQCPDLLVVEQLGVRAWHVCDHADLHAHRSLVVLEARKRPCRSGTTLAPLRQRPFR